MKPTPKILAGPVSADYADLPEDERLAIAAGLATNIQELRED